MDPATREALTHATARGDWRAYSAYVDRLLDEALAARAANDAADLERLYRAPAADLAKGDTAAVRARAALPFDHGADWGAP